MTEAQQKLRKRLRLLLIFLVLIFGLVWIFRAVLMPFLVALFFAYLIDPLVERMAVWKIGGKFRLGRAGSIIIIYLVLISTATVGFLYAIPAVGRQVIEVREDLPGALVWAEENLATAQEKWNTLIGNDPEPEGDAKDVAVVEGRARFVYKEGDELTGVLLAEDGGDYWVLHNGDRMTIEGDRLDHYTPLDGGASAGFRSLAERGAGLLEHNINSVLGFAVGFAKLLLGIFTRIVLIMMITAFVIIDRERIVAFLHSLPPPHYKQRFDTLTDYLDRGLAGVIRGQLMICLVNGLLTWVGLWLFDVRYAALLGLIAGIFSLIPVFGTILLIHFIEANFLNPKIMGNASKIHPVVIFFSLLAGEHAYGIVGALLAVPTASLLQSAFQFFVLDRRGEHEPAPEAA